MAFSKMLLSRQAQYSRLLPVVVLLVMLLLVSSFLRCTSATTNNAVSLNLNNDNLRQSLLNFDAIEERIEDLRATLVQFNMTTRAMEDQGIKFELYAVTKEPLLFVDPVCLVHW